VTQICKLYLYHSEHTRALAHFNRHLHRFSSLSRGWGIGEETFEFWSWVARQYRALGEMIEAGLSAGLTLPVNIKADLNLNEAPPPLDIPGVEKVGLNPAVSLQHPGFYYYAAASCTQQRYERFLAMAEHEVRSTLSLATHT